ncbi:MAG: hypothetical protein ACJAUD_000833 [Crocinitomicaceae bacterium]|jgi:hypothetical protein
MNLRSLILFTSSAILVLNSCDKPPTAKQIDTSYLGGLVGDYSIYCQVNYIDSNGMYQYIDTTYVGALTSDTEDLMLLEFLDNATMELEFTYDHQVRTGCVSNVYGFDYGAWIVQDNVPSFEFNQGSVECIIGFLGNSIDLTLSATKL